MKEFHLEIGNWNEQYENAQNEVDQLVQNRDTLEQQARTLATELAIEKAASAQARQEKITLETSFSEQLSKASEEIRGLKALLDEKETYSGELVTNLTKAQDDLRASKEKIDQLENSVSILQSSLDSALVENEAVKNDIEVWEKDYELLEDKSTLEISWVYLNSHHDTLVEASQEGLDLNSELKKIKETIEQTQKNQELSPLAEDEVNASSDAPAPVPNVEPSNELEPVPEPEPIAEPAEEPAPAL